MRVGIGYDVHPLIKGRRLVLGGTNIPYEMGLSGHSDADVLSHSIGDALLGAAGKRDIGFFFPDNDIKYKGISSLSLLKEVLKIIRKDGLRINNIDATLVAEEPKLSPYIHQMRKNITRVLQLKLEQIGIKATTSEGLGFLGEKKGIACWAIASLASGEKDVS
ncbi:MAG: 2-C-methyl-D-erythritol 2,4-cyclodiphosphate synthase [Candidatus Aerophobetes bacterium]|nr:2-C-methyl-D-erythritol 2,4-cyclodiphosphate synthase [Candidatus Aerophobetes bacterium]